MSRSPELKQFEVRADRGNVRAIPTTLVRWRFALPLIAIAAVPAAAQATAPGANGRIVFVSDRDHPSDPHDYDLFAMNANGTGVTHITNNATTIVEWEPSYSPDGKKIAYRSVGTQSEILVINADGSNPVNITNNRAADEDPSFSPDGKKIVFRSNRDGDFEIYVVNANGTGTPVQLTHNTTFDGEPVWSPDGTRIIFNEAIETTGTQNDIVSIKADGAR